MPDADLKEGSAYAVITGNFGKYTKKPLGLHSRKCLVKTTKNLVLYNQTFWLIWYLSNVWLKPNTVPYQTFLVGFQPNNSVAVFV
jgi:hypothetical protein